jgi:periplasmic protein TonB
MDEILFQKRNKTYGAYDLRKKYARVLSFSAIITLATFTIFIILVFFKGQIIKKDTDNLSYIFNLKNYGHSLPQKRSDPPASGGIKIPNRVPLVVDSLSIADTIINNADGNGSDTTGHGNGNGNGSEDGQVYFSAQEPPAFPGGEKERMRFLQQNINYPPQAKQKKIHGTVYISFIVEKNGSISNIKLLRGIGYGCDEEAVRVVNSMPKWSPGKQNGVAVRVQIVIPLVFIINNSNT